PARPSVGSPASDRAVAFRRTALAVLAAGDHGYRVRRRRPFRALSPSKPAGPLRSADANGHLPAAAAGAGVLGAADPGGILERAVRRRPVLRHPLGHAALIRAGRAGGSGRQWRAVGPPAQAPAARFPRSPADLADSRGPVGACRRSTQPRP